MTQILGRVVWNIEQFSLLCQHHQEAVECLLWVSVCKYAIDECDIYPGRVNWIPVKLVGPTIRLYAFFHWILLTFENPLAGMARLGSRAIP